MVEDADDHEAAHDAPAQLEPALQTLVERLRGIDPNELRPRDALDLLYELHELAAPPDSQR
jgi:DNA mismatch repair protein MutS